MKRELFKHKINIHLFFLQENIMLFYTCKAQKLKQISETLKDILAECWFVFDSTSIVMRNVDPEKVVSVHLYLRPPSDQYRCTSEFTFPFYIQTLYRIFRGVRLGDMATIQDIPNGGGAILISIHTEKGVLKNEIRMKPLQSQGLYFLTPPIKYDVDITFESCQLYNILRDLSSLSRKVVLQIDGRYVSLIAEDDYGTISTHRQDFDILNYQFKNTYLSKYLEKFSKPGLGESITLRVCQGVPLTALYNLEHGSLTMSISPSE